METTTITTTAGTVGNETLYLPQDEEFPLLSEQPIQPGQTMPPDNPVDQNVLAKDTASTLPPGQLGAKPQKDLRYIVPQTVDMQKYGTKQAKHTNAITMELKLLLEHEKKLLEQITTRCDKFKGLVDDNKNKTKEWSQETETRIPEYSKYLDKLAEIPHNKPINVEGVPGQVQQKILFQIVSKTASIANNVLVQLSMQETIVNDIDMTLGEVKKHCTVMLKQIETWLKMLKTQECHQKIVMDRWDTTKTITKDLKPAPPPEEKPATEDQVGDVSPVSGPNVDPSTSTLNGPMNDRQLNDLKDRIKHLEDQINGLAGILGNLPSLCTPCPGTQVNPPTSPPQGYQQPEMVPGYAMPLCRKCAM